MSEYSIFAWMGSMYLIILAYQDIRHNMQIDDRYNFLMLGLALGLIGIAKPVWWFILVLIGAPILMTWLLKRSKAIGEGDLNSLNWIVVGFGLLGAYRLICFFYIFTVFSLLFLIAWQIIKRKHVLNRVPFMPVICGSFITTAILTGSY